jgi:hypothetical protein
MSQSAIRIKQIIRQYAQNSALKEAIRSAALGILSEIEETAVSSVKHGNGMPTVSSPTYVLEAATRAAALVKEAHPAVDTQLLRADLEEITALIVCHLCKQPLEAVNA